jgi:hypothetical protein
MESITAAASASRPLSIKELADAAEDYKWTTSIELKYWIRAATALLSQVCSPHAASSAAPCLFLFR